MQKIKIKRYMTKNRRLKKKGWKAIMVFMVLMAMGIAGGFLKVITPIQAESYDLTVETSPRGVQQAIEAKEMTIEEHICAATNGENCDVIHNLCLHESGTWITGEPPCQKYSVNENTNGTFDYSYLQINDVHIIGRAASKGRGTITMDCVYDLYCASRWANQKIKNGGGHIWVAWNKI